MTMALYMCELVLRLDSRRMRSSHEWYQISEPKGVLCLDVDSDEWRQSSHVDHPVRN